jgi:hypothetical protein
MPEKLQGLLDANFLLRRKQEYSELTFAISSLIAFNQN